MLAFDTITLFVVIRSQACLSPRSELSPHFLYVSKEREKVLLL